MVNKNRDDRVFNRCLQNQQEGHAVFTCVSAADLKPGVCGYFDRNGDWQKIVNILDADDAARAELEHQTQVSLVDPAGEGSTERWGVRRSENMQKVTVSSRGGASHEGVKASATATYKTSKQAGVVFLTRGCIQRSHVDPEAEYKFLSWMQRNGEKIVKKHAAVKERGVWIITKTTSVPHRAFALVRSSDTEITFGVSVDAAGAASLEPSTSWWEGQKDDMWKDHSNPKGVVLFICGIKWEPTVIPWYTANLRPELNKEKQHLGAGDDFPPVEIVDETPDRSSGQLTRLTPEIIRETS